MVNQKDKNPKCLKSHEILILANKLISYWAILLLKIIIFTKKLFFHQPNKIILLKIERERETTITKINNRLNYLWRSLKDSFPLRPFVLHTGGEFQMADEERSVNFFRFILKMSSSTMSFCEEAEKSRV